VNLHLSVGGLREDGYHELVTVFHAVDVTDEIVATPSSGLSVAVEGVGDGIVPTDWRNLAWRAAELLARTAGVAPDVHLRLRKAIPVEGGMAGGSADGAAALVACARLWEIEADLPALAAELGADVAFPLLGGTAVGTGRGEELSPVPAGPLHWVFAPSNFGISARSAYEELDRLRSVGATPPPTGSPDALLAALAAGDVAGVGAALANDLQPAAFALRPELRRTYDLGLEAGAVGAVVSGSGPTIAFLCADSESAEHLAAVLQIEGLGAGALVARGPVAGAQVID
jgi:4-diphosphocytidyl-2-C-methyl-D-erythritol kinase